MKKVILICVAFFATIPAVCQDYVVTLKGDTLRGELKLFAYDIIDRVQVTHDKKKEMFTAVQVKTVFFKDEVYLPIRTIKRYCLMKPIKSGYLTLYAFQLENQLRYDGRFLAMRDGRSMELPNLAFKKLLTEFLKDCIEVSKKVEDGELGKKEINDIVDGYNQCIDYKTSLVSREAEINPAKSDSLSTVRESKLQALDTLKSKIEASDLTSKNDVLDLLKNLSEKVKSDQPIPSYLTEGLKGYLGSTPYKDDLEKVLATLRE